MPLQGAQLALGKAAWVAALQIVKQGFGLQSRVDLEQRCLAGASPTHREIPTRQGNWKLVRADLSTDRPFGDIAKKPMLVNLKDDIGETKDLSAAHPEKVKELTEVWQKWNAGLVPPAWLHHSLQKPKK